MRVGSANRLVTVWLDPGVPSRVESYVPTVEAGGRRSIDVWQTRPIVSAALHRIESRPGLPPVALDTLTSSLEGRCRVCIRVVGHTRTVG